MSYRTLLNTILVFTHLISNAQTNSDTAYKYQYIFYQRAGLKDKSELIIQKSQTDSLNEFNVVGTIVWKEQIHKGPTDSVEYLPGHARLTLRNKHGTIEKYLDDKIKLHIPQGKYHLFISEVGMGFIDKKIRIEDNAIYTFNINLKTRRSISKIKYRCKSRMSKKEIKAIKKHYTAPGKYDLPKNNCDCDIFVTIYG